MTRLPTVAIIGRPNTGKSTLFNRLSGSRRAIESEFAGTTRDHVAQRVETDTVDYLLVDTGGMAYARTRDWGRGTGDDLDVHTQSLLAIEAADLILFTVNAREEITASDREIITILRKRKRRHVPVLLIATKCDNAQTAQTAEQEFENLRAGAPILPVSAPHNLGISELRNRIVRELHALHFQKPQATSQQSVATAIPRVAIVGKPNVGKSSLTNALMSEPDRATSPRMVSLVPGTTRDATDTIIRHAGTEYVFVDTAGLRHDTARRDGIEYFAFLRSMQAIEECDVAVLLLDGSQPLSRQDKRIAAMIAEAGKGIVIAVNKMDLVKNVETLSKTSLQDSPMTSVAENIHTALPFCRFAPVIGCSAITRQNLPKLFPLIDLAHRNRLRQIGMEELQDWYVATLAQRPLGPLTRSKHIVQTEDVPPTFTLSVRNPKEIQVAQLKFLERRLRVSFAFEGTPVRFVTKSATAK